MPRRGAAPQQQHPRIERRDRRQFILSPCAESVREVASSAASLTSVAKQRSGGCCHAAGSWLVRCAAWRERSARTTEHMTYPLPQPISKQLRAGRGYEYVQRSCTARTPLAASVERAVAQRTCEAAQLLAAICALLEAIHLLHLPAQMCPAYRRVCHTPVCECAQGKHPDCKMCWQEGIYKPRARYATLKLSDQ